MRQTRNAGYGVRWLVRLALIGALIGMTGVVRPGIAVRAATLTVTTCADSGMGSLRQQLAVAMPNDTITFTADCTGANAIKLTTGNLTLTQNVTIDATSAPQGTITVDGRNAVQVFVVNSGVTVALTALTIQNGNGGGFSGGGIANRGTLTVTNSTLTGNTAGGGGGIVNSGTLIVANSTFANNNGGNAGGGIFSSGIPLTVTNSTFSGNTAASGNGGGIANSGTATVTASTIADNKGNTGDTSPDRGIVNFSGSTLTLTRSIVSDGVTGTFTDGGNNLINSFGNGTINALLAPLGNYGGPTQTRPPLSGSPAIDTGGSCTGPDQRGVSRPQGAACDIGAVESRGFTLTAGGSGQSAAVNTAFAAPFTATAMPNAAGEPVNGGLVTFTITPGAGGASAAFGAVGSTGCLLNNPNFANPLLAICPVIGGVATTPPLIANGTAGSFTATATATGVATPATYTGTVTGTAVALAFVVTRTADDVNDANCTAASCTLRQAINASNANDPGAGRANTITFAVDAPTASPISLTIANDPGPLGGIGTGLRLSRSVTIDATAPMHTIAVNGLPASFSGQQLNRFTTFVVNPGITAAFKGLTIQNASGGGIVNNGTLTVTACTFSGNTKTIGFFDAGGGIDNLGTLTVTGSTFSNNAADVGGALANDGTLTVTGSTFSNNAAEAGGGITNTAMASVATSTFSGNRGGLGGGISNLGTLTVTTSTFSGNTANRGGGISNLATLTVMTSTFFGNTATGNGGGIAVTGGTLTLTGSIVVPAVSGTFTDGGNNLNSDTVDPKLAPLANYGGPTQTLALLPTSPAIDAGAATCPYTAPLTHMAVNADQRGVPRPQGVACDIGAFELRGPGLIPGGGGQNAPVNTSFAAPLTATPVANDSNVPLSTVTPVTFTITPGAGGASAAFGTAANCTNPNSLTAVCTVVGGVATSPAFTANGTAGSFTVTLTAPGVPAVTVTETNVASAVTLTGLTVTAPAANGGTTPTVRIGGFFTLTTTGLYSNSTTGPVSGVTYTSSNPGVAAVDPSTGVLLALTGGQTTITVTGPNNTRTQITVTVMPAPGSGLMPPARPR